MEYKGALDINTGVSTSEAFLCSYYLNENQESYRSVGSLFVYSNLFKTQPWNGFPGLIIAFCRLGFHCEHREPLGFSLKIAQGFEIWKAAGFCGKGWFLCFCVALKFKHNICTRTKSLGKTLLCLNSKILPLLCMAINDQIAGISKLGPVVLWIPELVAMKYCTVNVNCQGWQFNLLNVCTETLLFFLKLCRLSQPQPGTAQHHIP